MDIERSVVDPEQAGVRLDKWLSEQRSVGSRSKARQALRSGKVSVDGRGVSLDEAGLALAAGATVEIAWSKPGTSKRRTTGREELQRARVAIVHQDEVIVVADKPSELLTDAADQEQQRHRDTLRKRIAAWLGAPVWPAHRIDRDTTGLVAFARSEPVRDALMAQWRARTPDRVYLAVVEGAVGREAGRWTDWMAWDGKARVQRPCAAEAGGAFLAEADWRVVERLGGATLIEVRLVSGRRNQIRLQAMLRGHALVGEGLYRRGPARIPFPRQALHAARLAFDHPVTGARVTVEAPLPADLQRLLSQLRGSR
jgi:23S rRNA pseudouridine1911/1915/1917 synthase